MHEEKDLTPETLCASVRGILENKDTAAALSNAIRAFAKPTAADDIYKDLILLTDAKNRIH